jgi:hypothetical protein
MSQVQPKLNPNQEEYDEKKPLYKATDRVMFKHRVVGVGLVHACGNVIQVSFKYFLIFLFFFLTFYFSSFLSCFGLLAFGKVILFVFPLSDLTFLSHHNFLDVECN